MAAPGRGVVADAMALGFRRVENRLDSLAETVASFRLRLPDRRQNGQNGRRVDFVDWPALAAARRAR